MPIYLRVSAGHRFGITQLSWRGPPFPGLLSKLKSANYRHCFSIRIKKWNTAAVHCCHPQRINVRQFKEGPATMRYNHKLPSPETEQIVLIVGTRSSIIFSRHPFRSALLISAFTFTFAIEKYSTCLLHQVINQQTTSHGVATVITSDNFPTNFTDSQWPKSHTFNVWCRNWNGEVR